MAMDRINGSSLYPRSMVEKFQNTSRKADDKDAEAGAVDAGGVKPQTEKAEISEAAHDLMDLRKAVDTGREALSALPDVRKEKVEQAKTRLAQGYYNSVEVRDEIAGKLDKVLGEMDKL